MLLNSWQQWKRINKLLLAFGFWLLAKFIRIANRQQLTANGQQPKT